MSSARQYWLDLSKRMRAAPYKSFLWPQERGDLDGIHWLKDSVPEFWKLLPSEFRQTWYEYNFRWNRRQRFKAIDSDAFKDFGPAPYEKPAPDSPAVTS